MMMPDTPDTEALEARIAELERTVDRLVKLTGLPASGPILVKPKPVPRPIAPTDLAPAPALPSLPPQPRAREFDLEQWVGGRGLLLVGVVALLTASGLFLKYAFDRGWVAPWLRVAGAILAGVAVTLYGEREVRNGLRRFGLALAGAGGGLIYLGLWAAAGPYVMLSRQVAIGAIALTAGLFAWRAIHHQAEALALWALLGAYAAPYTLPLGDARPEAFLSYLGIASVTAMALGHAFGWRLAFGMALAGYFLLAPITAFSAMHQPFGFLYLALGGLAAQRIAAEREWPEVRFGVVALPWVMMVAHATMAELEPARIAAFTGALILLLASWQHDRLDQRLHREPLDFELDDRGISFLLAPAGFAAVAAAGGPGFVGAHPYLATLGAAGLYLVTGWPMRCAPYVAVALGLVAVALAQRLDGAALVGAWSGLMVVSAGADRRLAQQAGFPLALLTGVAAASLLAVWALAGTTDAGRAFTGPWSLAWYALVVACAATALQRPLRPGIPAWQAGGHRLLWFTSGLTIFIAGSLELARFFGGLRDGWDGAELAGDLAISVFWLLYAGALVALGFRLEQGPVRSAGLLVAVMAVMKIALYDLSRLEALYRVGSFFVLALISLAVAWAYNRAIKERAG